MRKESRRNKKRRGEERRIETRQKRREKNIRDENVVQYSIVQCSVVQYNIAQYSIVQCNITISPFILSLPLPISFSYALFPCHPLSTSGWTAVGPPHMRKHLLYEEGTSSSGALKSPGQLLEAVRTNVFHSPIFAKYLEMLVAFFGICSYFAFSCPVESCRVVSCSVAFHRGVAQSLFSCPEYCTMLHCTVLQCTALFCAICLCCVLLSVLCCYSVELSCIMLS